MSPDAEPNPPSQVRPSWMHRKPGGRGAKVPDFSARSRENRAGDLVLHLPRRRLRSVYVYFCATCGARCDGPAMFCPGHLQLTLRP